MIGGGVAGLVATRHLADSAWPTVPTMFEQTNSLGGTWVYTDTVGKDEYGLPVHSSMYKSLRYFVNYLIGYNFHIKIKINQKVLSRFLEISKYV